jgi:arabinogalactan endo-1,4-beta-galactosidase
VKYDVIGLSYYPFGLKRLYRDDSRFREQFKDMASRYNKVMVVEVGGIDEQIENTQMLIATIKAVKNVPNNKGWVLFIGNHKGKKLDGYSLSAWQNDGKPSAALNAFKE